MRFLGPEGGEDVGIDCRSHRCSTFLVTQRAHPCICLMDAGEGGKRPDILQEGTLRWACRANGRSILVDDKFHAVSLLQSKPIPNLEGESDLTLAADCAGACHLYLPPLQ